MLQDFINYLLSHVNKSIYVWGGQGEFIDRNGNVYNKKGALISDDAEKWIKAKETSATNASRVIKTYNKIRSAYNGNIYCFDCSGLGMYYLFDSKKIASSDLTANGMKGKCEIISKDELKKGCWVFRTYKTGSNKGRAYHVGYVVDDNLNVVESKGRDYGVVKKAFSSTYWNTYGMPSYFKEEILAEEESKKNKPVFERTLKRVTPTMTGEDVRNLQLMLNEVNGANLAADGKYGPATEKAVRNFQAAKGLKQTGIADKATIEALGGIWKEKSVVYVFTRTLKRTTPTMTGEDVKNLQTLLNRVIGAGLTVDGKFGPATEVAVKNFQRAYKLDIDGKAGPKTIAALGGKWAA